MSVSRWMRNGILAVLIGLMAGMAGCGGGGEAGPENVYIADEADSGQTVTMGIGDMLQITLPENQSTGYLWNVVTNDEAVLRTSGEPAYEVDSDAEGAGGQKTFMFEGVAAGTTILRLVNAMTQDTAVEPDRVFELTIQVVE